MDCGSTRRAFCVLAVIEFAMHMIVGHQAKQQKKCELLKILELGEASKPKPMQTATLKDTHDFSVLEDM